MKNTRVLLYFDLDIELVYNINIIVSLRRHVLFSFINNGLKASI